MGAIVDRAEAIAEQLRSGGMRATTDIRDTTPPCVLVVPIPVRDYSSSTLSGSFLVTWTLVALATAPADLEAARALEELVDQTAELVDIERAEPASYVIPGAEQAVPAYLLTYTEQATEE
jgi:hypothetical protein